MVKVLCVSNYENSVGVVAIAYSSRTVCDLAKQTLFRFTSYDARIQI
jgi:hypothetical protein